MPTVHCFDFNAMITLVIGGTRDIAKLLCRLPADFIIVLWLLFGILADLRGHWMADTTMILDFAANYVRFFPLSLQVIVSMSCCQKFDCQTFPIN